MKFKAILLDADGVTLKDEGYFSNKLREQGRILPQADTDAFFTGVFPECIVGKADLKEELKKVVDGWGWKGTVDELIDFWFSVGDDLDEKVATYIHEARARGVKCYMATDQEQYRGRYLRQKFSNIFDDFFIANEIGCTKKDPEYFEFVLKQLGSLVKNPSEVLFIDDGENNVENAKSVGIEAVLFRTTADLPRIMF